MLKDVDRGYKRRMKLIGAMGGVVTVGIHAAEGQEAKEPAGKTPVTVLMVAIWNEFGTGRIPARSFIGAWFDANQERAGKIWAALMRQVAAGKITQRQAFELFGMKVVGEIQQRIADGIPPDNAASTIARKGSSKPLIDTGQLRTSVTFRATTKT